jgi:seryl-tRNA synthetase
MIDITLFRETPEIIIKSEKKRFKDPNRVQRVIDLDKQWRTTKTQLQVLQQDRNTKSRQVAKTKDPKVREGLISSVQNLNAQIRQLESQTSQLLEERDEERYKVGNILHETVPNASNEDGNIIIRESGKIPRFKFEPRHHVTLGASLGVDTEKAAEVSGSRFYYLKDDLVVLNIALLQYGIHFLRNAGYTVVWTPFMIKREVMEAASELADLDDQLYKIENEDLFLIATSEQTLAALHRNELIDEDDLPIKYAGISSCFRREAGSHGKDTKGIFRVHQFEKVEQYVYTRPEESWRMHDEMIQIAEEIYKQLELPYRITNIASGEMNDNAAKKFDLEVYFPAQKAYREVVSCSNCTDYQARKLNIRFGKAGSPVKQVVHTLNSTLIATERTISALLENHQREDGSIVIPKMLHPYTLGLKTLIPQKKK